jgi:CreA protein
MKVVKFIGMCIAAFMMQISIANAEVVGSVTTKGFLFKDGVEVHAFDDPTIDGVTCYVTMAKRKATSWLSEEPSDSSLACRQTGPITGKLTNSDNVFSRDRNIFFKKTLVTRMYDKKRNVLVYLVYTKATSGNNRSHSISVVPVK